MKIKKEFVPLILNGEKIYEFRTSHSDFIKEHEGLYKIQGEYYFLKYIVDTYYFNEVLDYCKKNYEEKSLDFIVEQGWHKKNFLPKGNVFIIYKWKKLDKKELKIVE